jgi:hypothetical protein
MKVARWENKKAVMTVVLNAAELVDLTGTDRAASMDESLDEVWEDVSVGEKVVCSVQKWGLSSD